MGAIREGRAGWAMAFGGIVLLSLPIDQWQATPAWLGAAWQFLASNQALFAILLVGAILLKAFVLENTPPASEDATPDPLALSSEDHRLLQVVLQLPQEIPAARWAGRALLVMIALLGFRWLSTMKTLQHASEFRTLVGEVFWVALIVAMGWLCLRLLQLVRSLHTRLLLMMDERD